jgi:hypothetical protein
LLQSDGLTNCNARRAARATSGFFNADEVTAMFKTTAMVILALPFAAGVVMAADAESALPSLSEAEQAAGWKLLFDGRTLDGWRGLGMDDVPPCWVVADGCLKCLGGYKNIADLITVDQYDNFEFAFEWRFPKTKGNSGVKYRVQEEKGKTYAFGCEYQCFTDSEVVDDHSSGALYDLLAPRGKKSAPPGEFNSAKIVVQGNHLEHWLNGVKVVEAEFGSPELEALRAKSYFKKSAWGKEPLGYLALQNHHSEVLFRNIKIRVLPAKAAKQR